MIVTDNYYAKQMTFDFNLINIGMSSLGGENTYKFSHRVYFFFNGILNRCSLQQHFPWLLIQIRYLVGSREDLG